MESEYLVHHGILGQKWGVRRYQNEDGTLTSAGKRRYLGSDGKLNARAKRDGIKTKAQITKERKAAEAAAEEERLQKIRMGDIEAINKDRDKYSDQEIREAINRAALNKELEGKAEDANRDRYVREGNVKAMTKDLTKYTDQQIRDAMTRFDLNEKITNLSVKDIKTGEQKARELIDKVKIVSSGIETGTQMYNNIAKVSNALFGTDMHIIGEKKPVDRTQTLMTIENGKVISKELTTFYGDSSNIKSKVTTRTPNKDEDRTYVETKYDSNNNKVSEISETYYGKSKDKKTREIRTFTPKDDENSKKKKG